MSMLPKAAEFLFGQVSMTHRFVVRIDHGVYDLGTWSKVTGLTVRWEKLVHRAGNDIKEQVVPGAATYETIKLVRAACTDSATVQRWLAVTSRKFTPLSGAVEMLDFTGMTVLSWELKSFFPIGWSISDFDSGSAKPAMETLELAHSGFLHDEAVAR
ncbi:phage tail protein [Actinokineospora bangkokensis]|uniref:Phage tail protein n=1 Tax=Actinokineospora bangkokensis TaxID=1193682 RepID=A0A1Q9LLE9_9PSEU|nr:phage tail protein [Actinokineospora bangkokensis]OLR92867.1 hypothetical protein BJP25_19270 [Actinokineospora bangkokensis]